MATYRVVINGVLKGLEAGQVAPQLAAVCKIPVEGAKALLANSGTVIKGGLDQETAHAYKATLRGVGCQVLLEQEAKAGAAKRLFASLFTRSRKPAASSAPDPRQGAGKLGQKAQNALNALTSLTQRYVARPDHPKDPTDSMPSTSLSPLMTRWQHAANWVSAKIAGSAPRISALPRAKKFLGVNVLIIASVAVTAVAIASVFVGSSPSPDGPCPKEFQATSTATCVGEVNFPNGEKYAGELKDGQPDGRGTFTWPNGEKYIGEWKNGQRNGMGRFFWPDGTKYVGEFRNNKRHGEGTYTYADGRKSTGRWKDGNPVQEPVVTVQKPVASAPQPTAGK